MILLVRANIVEGKMGKKQYGTRNGGFRRIERLFHYRLRFFIPAFSFGEIELVDIWRLKEQYCLCNSIDLEDF